MNVTQLLLDLRNDERAADQLFPLVYDQMRRLAKRYMAREQPGHTLQATALVHEAYAHLVQGEEVDWKDRSHFFAIAAISMRRILVQSARARNAAKRGGGRQRVSINESLDSDRESPGTDVLDLDQALQRLEARNERQAKVVEMRFFAGLSEKEIASVLGVSERTVREYWAVARAFLHRELKTLKES